MNEQPLPHAKRAERAVIGALITNPGDIHAVTRVLDVDDFLQFDMRSLYQAILNLYDAGLDIDILSVGEEARSVIGDDKKADAVERQIVDVITGDVMNPLSARTYAVQVADAATRRRVILAAGDIAKDAWKTGDATVPISAIQQLIQNALDAQNGEGDLRHISTLATAFFDDLKARRGKDELPGITSGYTDFDRITNGLGRSHLYIIAGRPAMGKTALSLGILDHVALKCRRRVAYFSLEMSADQLLGRMVASRLHVDTKKLATGQFDVPDDRLDELRERFMANVYISDRGGQTVDDIANSCVRQQNETGLDLVIVDYLQLVRSIGGLSRYEQVSRVVRRFKDLAKLLDVPVIVLSQLNRSVESRSDHRPLLSDLRDSGEIEEAADIVAFLYRAEYYEPDNPAPSDVNKGELIVGKNRHGPVGTVGLYFDAETASYRNLKVDHVEL